MLHVSVCDPGFHAFYIHQRPPLHIVVVATEKGAFKLDSTTVANLAN